MKETKKSKRNQRKQTRAEDADGENNLPHSKCPGPPMQVAKFGKLLVGQKDDDPLCPPPPSGLRGEMFPVYDGSQQRGESATESPLQLEGTISRCMLVVPAEEKNYALPKDNSCLFGCPAPGRWMHPCQLQPSHVSPSPAIRRSARANGEEKKMAASAVCSSRLLVLDRLLRRKEARHARPASSVI